MKSKAGASLAPQKLKIATFNVGKNLMGKLKNIMREMKQLGVQVVMLQEIGIGAKPHQKLKDKGWYYKAADGEDTGVAIIVPWGWQDYVEESWQGGEGRYLGMRMSLGKIKTTSQAIYSPTGLDHEKKKGRTEGDTRLGRTVDDRDP